MEHNVFINYITRRGEWYKNSWKGDIKKSGGILFNIGIHLFDLMIFLFGKPYSFYLYEDRDDYKFGEILFKKASVRFTLSTNSNLLPNKDMSYFRSISIDGKEINFEVEGLHNKVYENLVSGIKYGIEDVMESIKLVDNISKFSQ
jgi:UDP-N-acetyl-2-amino-2-deoxyglucuronate dehydrogenase